MENGTFSSVCDEEDPFCHEKMAKILWIVLFLLGKKKRKEGGFAGEFVCPEPPIRLFLEARHVSLDGGR